MTQKKLLLIILVPSSLVALSCLMLLVAAMVSPTSFRHVLNTKGRMIYGYNSRSEDFGSVVIDESHRTVTYGDVAQNAKFCNLDSRYKCVDGAGFHFAVPYELKGARAPWAIDGYLYQVQSEDKVEEIGGRKINVMVIDSNESPDMLWTYYYSPDWGLLAFDQKVGKQTLRREIVSCFGFGGIKSGSLMRYLFDSCWNTDTTGTSKH